MITVIIPTMGRPTLRECILSLLSQSKKPDELLIIDNSPNRQAWDIISKCHFHDRKKIIYFHEKKIGASNARNRGITLSKGKMICFIDDDCVADRNWVRNLYLEYRKYRGKAVVKGENKNGNPNNIFSSLIYFQDEFFFKRTFSVNKKNIESFWLDTKNFMIPRGLIVKHHLHFNPYPIFEDIDFSLQLKRYSIPIYYSPTARVCHFGRQHLISYLKREKDKIKGSLFLNKAWSKKEITKKIRAEIMKQDINKKWKSEKDIKKELYEEIVYAKTVSFKALFCFLLAVDNFFSTLFEHILFLVKV